RSRPRAPARGGRRARCRAAHPDPAGGLGGLLTLRDGRFATSSGTVDIVGCMSDAAIREPMTAADLHYPEALPVVACKDDIAEALREHQVIVVAGETGSGKTTQLPKIALEIGRGTTGQIGHTQPRRIAARSVAQRIAEEMQVELGGLIGYQVRFSDRSSDRTAVKVMTDGILLNEMQRDRDLRRYDTIIIDEAHERSLNIDF